METPEDLPQIGWTEKRDSILVLNRNVINKLDEKSRGIDKSNPKADDVINLLREIEKAINLHPRLIEINKPDIAKLLLDKIESIEYDLFVLMSELTPDYWSDLSRAEIEKWIELFQLLIQIVENDLQDRKDWSKEIKRFVKEIEKSMPGRDIRAAIEKSGTDPITPEDEARFQ